jgi:predicted SprT family Zn-dependent metalloprotease
MTATDPTRTTYIGLSEAYDFFNERLFAGHLPRCLITMRRHRKAFGYFSPARFGTRDGAEVTDEIALNALKFAERSEQENLATLVHEMCHLEQQHFGQPPRGVYHNREWARLMLAVGLVPSTTGEPGGKQTGRSVRHYIEKGGVFDQACSELLKAGVVLRYVDRQGDEEERQKKAASKTKYTCSNCGLNAWAKPEVELACIACGIRLEPESTAAVSRGVLR